MLRWLIPTWITLAGAFAWAQNYKSYETENINGVTYQTTSEIRLQDDTLFLKQNYYVSDTQEAWQEQQSWTIENEIQGYALATNPETVATLTYSKKMVNSLSQSFQNSEELQSLMAQAKGFKTCSKGLKNYRAIFTEINRDFTAVLKVLCFQ